MNVNPITRLDYPDPDVIRVEDTYYMVSTTMHFMPGCEILQSFDLVHWEHVTYVYETFDHTEMCIRDRFYSDSNIRYLENIVRDIKDGKAHFAEHDLIEED